MRLVTLALSMDVMSELIALIWLKIYKQACPPLFPWGGLINRYTNNIKTRLVLAIVLVIILKFNQGGVIEQKDEIRCSKFRFQNSA